MADRTKPEAGAGTRFGAVLTLLVAASLLRAESAVAADCTAPTFDGARDADRYAETVDACAADGREDAEAEAVLGYLYRNGYGVARDAARAGAHFRAALALEPCHAHAACGLRGLAGGDVAARCDIDCDALAQRVAPPPAERASAQERAYRLIAEMQRSGDDPVRLAADGLAASLEEILSQERELRDDAYRELCTGYVKRAVVTVSLAYQLERETRRRSRLIAHHEAKVAESNDARSQAALQGLAAAQRRAVADKQVFFEKYTGAVFSAGECEPDVLGNAYERFEDEIAEVQVTDLEQQAFGLFRAHVEDARAGQGISSRWFGNLDELLD